MTRASNTVEDEILVLAAQAGDTGAFEMLLRRWLPVMRRHAARLTGDAAAAEDVAQEACLALVGGLRRLQDPALGRTWMLRIVTNKAADWVRRRRRDRQLGQTLGDREPRTAPSDLIGGPPEGTAALVRDALQHLPADLRAVVSLYYGEGLSVAMVAAVVEAPAGTVKSRLHEARAQLRTILERNPT